MKIALLASQRSVHTRKWITALADRGYEVFLLTMHPTRQYVPGTVKAYNLPFSPPLGYFLNTMKIRWLLNQIQPDLLHSHYATGYGTLGRLSGFHPYIVSIWGSDVYGFPYASVLHRQLVVKNLRAADWICSTSHVMAEQAQNLCSIPNLTVTPFGVNVDVFSPRHGSRDLGMVTIGTVKTLAPKYGIDVLIRAFARVRDLLEREKSDFANKLRLLIVGGGSERQTLEALAAKLKVTAITTFVGAVPHSEVADYLNQLDIYVAASRSDSESFGVAVVEASACGLPIVVSDVAGFLEVVRHNETGLIVPRDDIAGFAEAMLLLIQDFDLRQKLGRNGRDYVLSHYNWQDNVTIMEKVYHNVLEK